MRILTPTEVILELSKSTDKYILYLSGLDSDIEDDYFIDHDGNRALRACPFLNCSDHLEIIVRDRAVLMFDTWVEMMDMYHLVYGDDGRSIQGDTLRYRLKYPIYEGEHRVYAATCYGGKWQTENT